MRVFSMTAKKFERLQEEYAGYCVACGRKADGIEPDAERYECEKCKQPKVYGIDNLLIMGRVKIK